MRELVLIDVIVILAISSIGFILTKIFFRDVYVKLAVYFFLIGYLIWSGIGIAYPDVDNGYMIQYAAFMLLFIIGAYVGGKFTNRLKIKPKKICCETPYVQLGAFVFWGLMLFKLVYPVNHIPDLFGIKLSIVDVFAKKDSITFLTYLANTLLVLLRPIYYFYLYKKCSAKKIVLLLVAEVYIGVAINGYISRSGLLSQALFIIFAVVAKKSGSIKMETVAKKTAYILKSYRKVIVIMGIACVLMIPLLFEYQYYRLGVRSNAALSIMDKVDALADIEFGFPKLIGYCEQFFVWTNSIDYMKWFVTLVIPKKIINVPDILLINTELSTLVSGISYGTSGFSMFLPGLLGEGIMLYGPYFAWVHGLFLGVVIGVVIGIYSRYKDMQIWVVYLLINTALMCRGGSQGTIAILVNGSVLVFFSSIFDSCKFRWKR